MIVQGVPAGDFYVAEVAAKVLNLFAHSLVLGALLVSLHKGSRTRFHVALAAVVLVLGLPMVGVAWVKLCRDVVKS